MVSNASEDLPEPDSPVMTTKESRGSSTVTSLRLCSRAPVTTMELWRLDIRPPYSLRRRRTDFPNRCSLRAGKPHGRGQQTGIEQLALEVDEPRLDAELLAGGPPQQLARVELAPMAVDVQPQPLAQRPEVPGGEIGLDVGQVVAKRAAELRGHQVADRVRREVADRPRAPVDVLQHALQDRRDLEPEQPVRRLVPRVGKVADREPPLHERQLELEAQRDVQVVGGLVGLDAD